MIDAADGGLSMVVACTATLATISKGDGIVKDIAAGRVATVAGVNLAFPLRMRYIKIWIWLFVTVVSSDVHSYRGFRAFLVQVSTEFIGRRGPVGKLAT